MDYLAGSKSVTPDKLFKTTGQDAALWLSACVAMFVVNVADTKTLDKQMLDYCLNNIQGNVKFLGSDPIVGHWGKDALKWRKWFDSGFKKDSACNPLLLSKSVSPPKVYDITNTTLEEFTADREKYFKNRPKLVGLICRGADLDAHLATLPEARRKVEEARYNTIRDLKHHVTRMLERNPYPKGILVNRKSGGDKPVRYRGTIAMGNDSFLVMRKRRYKWKDIAVQFYEEFMTHYAKQRVTGAGIGNQSLEERRGDAAEDYLGVAILYDWVGDYEKALDFAKRAVTVCPAKKKKVSIYMLK
jgi:tetratricopeptide (TPR) repeat protein